MDSVRHIGYQAAAFLDEPLEFFEGSQLIVVARALKLEWRSQGQRYDGSRLLLQRECEHVLLLERGK
jgi:hypothetical protein